MSNYNSDGPSDNEWDDRGELVWNEFDWEQYLRQQDETVLRYLAFYEKLKAHPERLDEAARQMGWSQEEWGGESDSDDDTEDESSAPAADAPDEEPYTLHKNPVFIATRALHLSLKRAWERLAEDPARVPQSLALTYYSALHRSEDQAILAIHSLDFGDYAMAISLLKRALRELNAAMARLTTPAAAAAPEVVKYRSLAMPLLFDLREVWLRVMSECRAELEQPADEEDES